jgi:DNA-binding GntR family transcriptional regulator
MALAEAVDKTNVWSILTVMKIHMDRVRQILGRENVFERTIAEHTTIVDAIERKDPDAAEASMRLHLQQILADLADINPDNARYFEDERL